MVRTLLVSTVLVAAACGAKRPATSTVASEPSAPAKAPPAGDQPALLPAVTAFHDKLAPLWHAAPGPERTKDTCASATELGTLAEDVEHASLPAAVDATKWSTEAGKLHTALGELASDCATTHGANLPTLFETVHQDFHGVIELLPADTVQAFHAQHKEPAGAKGGER
jgi:hypothetical protein